MLDPRIIEKIVQCWDNGMSIAGTKIAVRHAIGVKVTFSDIHPIFVNLSWGRTPA